MSSASQPKAIDVAAGLVFRDGRLLITQRQSGTHLAGLWEFPGGKREAGESWEQCLTRELSEELGIEVDVLECVEQIVHAYPEKTVKLRFFRCSWRRHEPRPIGCAALEWVTADALGRFDFPPADARLLDRLRADSTVWEA